MPPISLPSEGGGKHQDDFMSISSDDKQLKMEQTAHQGEHHHDDDFDFESADLPITRATFIFALCASVNSCNLGYDIGVSTEAGRLIQVEFGLSRMQRELFTGSINFWAMFGALFAHYFTDTYGRRYTFIVAALGFIVGILIQSFSTSYEILMFGRVFVGLGVGTGLAIDPLYIAEVTPAQHRGELVTWSEIAINVGLVFGFSTGLFLEWRAMFLFGGILPLVMIVLALTVMPESPRWLIANNRVHEAKCVLQQTYPLGYDVDAIVAGIEAQEREREAEHSIGWGVILHPTPAFRRMLFVGIGTAVSQQFVGIDAIQYYLIDVIAQSGIDTREKQSLVLIFLGLLKLVFVVIGGKLFDRYGRRPLLFTSLLGMAVALLMVSFSFLGSSKLSTGFTMFGLSLYLAFFSIGMGPGAWLLPSEVFANCIRGKAMSIAAFLNRVAATIMASTFLSTAEAIGWSGFFLLLAIASVTVFGVMYVYLPETKGRSIEDMSRYFAEITNDTSVLEAEARIRRRQEYASDKEEMEMTETQERSSAASPCLVT